MNRLIVSHKPFLTCCWNSQWKICTKSCMEVRYASMLVHSEA